MGKGYALSSRGRKLQRSRLANRLGHKTKQFAPVTCMPPCELPGKRKTAGQPKNKLVCFLGLSGGFSLCARAQQGQLRWPARKRGTALLLRLAFVAFTAANAALFGSFSGSEKERSRSFSSPSSICLYMQLFRSETVSVASALPLYSSASSRTQRPTTRSSSTGTTSFSQAAS